MIQGLANLKRSPGIFLSKTMCAYNLDRESDEDEADEFIAVVGNC